MIILQTCIFMHIIIITVIEKIERNIVLILSAIISAKIHCSGLLGFFFMC